MENNIVIGTTKISKRLDVTVPTIYNYIKKGMPYTQTDLGKKIFNMEDIHKWLLSRTKGE